MRANLFSCTVILAAAVAAGVSAGAEEVMRGERIDPALIGEQRVVTWEEIIAYDKSAPPRPVKNAKDSQGEWTVPSERVRSYPASGSRALMNKAGDTQIGITFPTPVDVRGANFAGLENPATSASAIQVVGYRNGVEVGRSEFLFDLGEIAEWLEMDLANVDRILVTACGKVSAGAWFSMDDLTYAIRSAEDDGVVAREVVLDFEDLAPRTTLTDSNYAGLTWEVGSGVFPMDLGVPAPISNETKGGPDSEDDGSYTVPETSRGANDNIDLLLNFRGIVRSEASGTFPPDTHSAIGPNHFVEVTNGAWSIYNRTTGSRISIASLGALLPGGSGDPRILFDQHSGRWIAIDSDFSQRIAIAVSATNSPQGAWFRTTFSIRGGSDASAWPDYPTLGVDAAGIYIAYFAVGGGGLSIAAIDKAPLVAPAQSMGTITFFRSLPFEGAIQPVHVYGTSPGVVYLVSRAGSNQIRVRQINPPLTAPTLTQPGLVTIATNSTAPDAPALNTAVPMDTIDTRLINAVYRDGMIWTAHTVAVSGRAAVRWYQIRVSPLGLVQQGTISDSVRHYYFPSIGVDSSGNACIGFSGSSVNEFIGVYYASRRAGDASGTMRGPILFQAGSSAINNIDNAGRNRWGDYSQVSIDPNDGSGFGMSQTFAHTAGNWGTQNARLAFLDCNNNGIPDACDIACGAGCPPGCGQAADCNANGVPDDCETDCNNNNIPDDCDLATGSSLDCNGNSVPDSCDIASGQSLDCNANGVPDSCDMTSGVDPDCNGNGTPDSCDIAGGAALDCNSNQIPDSCDIAAETSPDCNANAIPDSCDLANGTAFDCNKNGRLDSCDLVAEFVSESAELTPIGNGSPQQHTVVGAPAAIADVTLDFSARADISTSSEFISISLNGAPLGDIFVTGFSDCASPPAQTSITVPLATYNALLTSGGGNAVIDMVASANVNGNQCTPSTFIKVTVHYADGITNSQDANENGIPDECEGGLTGDVNCDGVVSVGDIGAFVLALTDPAGYAIAFPGCNILNADVNQDGNVTVGDIGPFVVLLSGP